VPLTVHSKSAKKSPNRIKDITYNSSGKKEKIAIFFEKEASYRECFLDHNPKLNLPYRLYLDFKDTTLGSKIKNADIPASSIIKRIRMAQKNSTTTRVVLDIKNKIFQEDYKITRSKNRKAIIIELTNKKAKQTDKTRSVKEVVLPEKYTKKTPVSDPDLCTVVIDPGHGGKDPGAIGYQKTKEKDVCLSLGLKLQKVINSKKGYKAILTRSSDIFLSLDERGAIANKNNADIFISIHANSHENKKITGIETYYLSFASDEEARKVAARENFTTPGKISDLEMIFFDLLQNNKINQSSILAGYIHNAMVSNISDKYHEKIRNLGIKHAPMRVLINAEMPCILIETAFISNPKEAKQLKSPAFQNILTASIFNGIENFRSARRTAFNKTAP
jgi:N-acetylmuramoyl-L-alanine amidase